MCRRVLAFVLVAVVGVLVPREVMAQSAIAGVVKDATGAVLPGVTVEASSPALIEKVRSATTNEAGQYRVVDLRPGTYSVSFTLAGFNTVVREGILLEANFVAPVNVEMKVGSLQETIYNDRVNQLDLNLTKSIRVNNVDIRPELGLFNILNGSAVTAQVNTFGPTLGRVNTILAARLLRFGLTMRF